MDWNNLAKYFVHGFVFFMLFLILAIIWSFVAVFLTFIGSFIGLIIGLGLFFLIVGFLNSVITFYLWFEVKASLWDLFLHGLVLFIILLVVNGISVTLPTMAFPGTATTAVTFIISSFLNGFVAKKVAGLWALDKRL